MREWLRRLDAAGRLAENIALVVLLGTMIVLAVLQIINRQLLDGALSIGWADEIIKIIVLWLAMVGSIAACRDGKHIRIDLISHILPPGFVRWARVVVDSFAAAVCAFIAWQAWNLVVLEREWGDMAALDIPVWLLHAIVPAAFALIAYRFAVGVLEILYAILTGSESELAT